jgi:hypothetical protein
MSGEFNITKGRKYELTPSARAAGGVEKRYNPSVLISVIFETGKG